MKLVFSQHIFEKKKYSNIKFYENLSSGSRVPCGQTDSRDEPNSRFSQTCERVEKWEEIKCVSEQAFVSFLFTF
jgi:hypothetical protein